MSDVVISARGLSKSYRVGHRATGSERDGTFREALGRGARNLIRASRDLLHGRAIVTGDNIEEFWALKDVSVDITRGDRVGIIGRNGAGKSTLLKILGRITEPTAGQVTIRGRIASLLEVGTGFHPELTGRENIYLNGAVLGITRSEINRKFDEIVAFAESEVERFLDTPVKRYSSGMYVRLAFSVAAHREAENMSVDEVLAVGDIEFQKKCMQKMEEISTSGRTILFVTHNIEFLRRLCTIGLILEHGRLAYFGDVAGCVKTYFGASVGRGGRYERDANSAFLSECVIRTAWIEQDGDPISAVDTTTPVDVFVRVEARVRCTVSLELLLRDENFKPIIFIPMGLGYGVEHLLTAGTHLFHVRLRLPRLGVGQYALDTMLAEAGQRFYDQVEGAVRFDVNESLTAKTGWVFRQQRGQGCIFLEGVECCVVNLR